MGTEEWISMVSDTLTPYMIHDTFSNLNKINVNMDNIPRLLLAV